jgi:hypothetical protein
LTAHKKWKYILHGTFDHHFKTELQATRILSFVKKKNIIEVPLNMSGLLPTGLMPMHTAPPIDLLYCGAFRKGRKAFFTKYLCSPYAKKWVVSTTQRKKFQALDGIQANIRGPYPAHLWKLINKSWAQIISSDDKDDNAPLPTRYWEAVSAQSVVFFTEQFAGTVSDDIIVTSPEELANNIQKLKDNPKWRVALLSKQNELAATFNPMKEWKINKWIK